MLDVRLTVLPLNVLGGCARRVSRGGVEDRSGGEQNVAGRDGVARF